MIYFTYKNIIKCALCNYLKANNTKATGGRGVLDMSKVQIVRERRREGEREHCLIVIHQFNYD
jgi:hypothetical protein